MMPRLPLKYRIAVTFALLALGGMALLLWQTLSLTLQASRTQLEMSDQVLLSLMRDVSRPALLTGNYTHLSPYFAHLLRDPRVVCILLTDTSSRVVAGTAPSAVGKPLPSLRHTTKRFWRTIDISTTTGPLGKLAIEYSSRPLRQAARQARDVGISIALIGLLLITIIGLAMGFLLTRRLNRLTQAAQRVAAGDWQVSSGVRGRDELGSVGQAFDAMVRETAKDRTRLEETQAQLTRRLAERQRAEEALQRQVKAMQAVAEVGRTMTTSHDPQVVLELIVECACRLLSTERSALAVREPERSESVIRMVAQRGLSARFPQHIRPRHWRDGTTPTALATRQPAWSADLLNDPAFDLTPSTRAAVEAEGYRAVLSVPLLLEDRTLGALVVYRDTVGPFSSEEIELLQIFASQAAIALENANLLDDMRQQTVHLARTNAALHDEIAERHHTEQALRESETRYRTLVENSLQGVLIHKDFTVLFANGATSRIFGYETPHELIGQDVRLMVAPHERARLEGYYQARLRQESVPTHYEYQGVRRDGTLVWIEAAGALVSWEGSLATLSTFIDVTERKQLEAQLLQARKMEAIGTLAGGIAHDFNNILAAMLGYTELALLDVPPDSTVERNLREVLTASKRARDLVKQILTFSRQGTPERQPLHLDALLQEILTLLRASLPSTIELVPHIASGVGPVLADPTQMHQVLLNLCTNAEHAMRATGGILEIGLEAIEVDAAFASAHPALQPGPHVRLRVRDTGSGIAPDIIERIFDPFFTTKEVGEGSGMGLAVVHGIITNHGGVITVESPPQQGTTFEIYLPQVEATIAAAPHAEEPIPGGTECILFVDDEPALVRLGQESLELLGYKVAAHTNGIEALEAFRAAPQGFDLVITDQTMPHMTGEALIQELRHIRPDIPVLLCTGFSDTMSAEKSRLLNLQGFLMKPLMTRELAVAVRRALTRRSPA